MEHHKSAEELNYPSLVDECKVPAADIGSKKLGIKYSKDSDYQHFSGRKTVIDLPFSDDYPLSKLTTFTDRFLLSIDRSELKNTVPSFF